MTAGPDFPAVITEANANRNPVPLNLAREALDDLFDEYEWAHETLGIRGDDYALTPTSSMRLVHRVQTKHARGEP